MNKIILKGRLTADPELRTTQSGTAVTSFTLAVDREYSKEGQRDADFFRCVAWSKTAEFVDKYFTKGQMMLLDGSMESREYEDKNGNNRIAWEVRVAKVEFCGSKNEKQTTNQDVGYVDEISVDDDDLPF